VATTPTIERWFAEKTDPPQKALRRVRDIILGADRRVTEKLQWGTIVFGFEGDMVSFVQANNKSVTLMFHRGRQIEGQFPHLEGTGPSARFMRFKDIAEANARATELSKIVAAWCTMMAAGGPSKSRAPSEAKTGTAAKPKAKVASPAGRKK